MNQMIVVINEENLVQTCNLIKFELLTQISGLHKIIMMQFIENDKEMPVTHVFSWVMNVVRGCVCAVDKVLNHVLIVWGRQCIISICSNMTGWRRLQLSRHVITYYNNNNVNVLNNYLKVSTFIVVLLLLL